MALASPRKKRRIQMIVFGAIAMSAATAIGGYVFYNSLVFFHPPCRLLAMAEAGEIQPDRKLRLGGMVAMGSVANQSNGGVSFDVTDFTETVTVRFDGVLPNLFREGQGVVTEGFFRNARFEATEVLAKHDEQYMPKEVAASLNEPTQNKVGAGECVALGY